MNQHLTPSIVRQFGIAFGLWGYTMDVALRGGSKCDNPDLIAVEESAAYAAVMKMIEEQDPPQVVKKQVSGVSVYVEEKPSALYQVMRKASLRRTARQRLCREVAPRASGRPERSS